VIPERRAAATIARAATLRARLLRWYRRRARDLPWRATSDPYAIWVSEVMLQQTRVETVVPYYRRFLERFPDVGALAAADEDAVLAAWSGLGYYRRARSLREGARAIVERHGGRLPASLEALRALPGIGRYTAGAIASIAFDRREPVVDGNVRRVLSRLAGPGPGDAPPPERALWEIAAALVDGPSPGDLNQAVMELGATVCTPRAPTCRACPVRTDCAAHAAGRTGSWPPARPRAAVSEARVAVAAVVRGDAVLLERPAAGGSPLRGRWDLPAIAVADGADGADALAEAMRRRHALAVAAGPVEARADHGILTRRLRLEIHRGRVRRGRVAGRDGIRWVDLAALDEVPVSGATRKALRAIGLDRRR